MKETKRKKVFELLEADQHRSDVAIAKEVGCVTNYVYNLRKELSDKSELRARREKQILSLLKSVPAWSPSDIAKAVRCPYSLVVKVRDEWRHEEQERRESAAAATSVSVQPTGVSAEVERSYVETNDLPPAPVEVVTRSKILSTAKSYITRDRQADHGDAEDNFSRIAGYWSLHTGTTLTATDVAVMMALLKVARIKQNPQHVVLIYNKSRLLLSGHPINLLLGMIWILLL
jgi:hypothetical protein